MAIIIFIIILAILIFVHEFGHFIVAKKSGIKVTEFGLGFPPKVFGIQYGETLYSLNAIPFGGFVRIFGENPDDESISGAEKNRSIVHKARPIQIAVLIAGVTFNVIFAWLLITSTFIIGSPTLTDGYTGPGIISDPQIVITEVKPNSPAMNAGLKPGDTILEISSEGFTARKLDSQIVSNFIEAHGKKGVTVSISRGKDISLYSMKATEGVVQGQIAIGIGMASIGTVKLPFMTAVSEGAKATYHQLIAIAQGLITFFKSVIVGNGNFSDVTGPVGIVSLVGISSRLGFVHLLSFTALISLNLAVINLLPFPALDGGRIVIVLIESIIRRRLPSKAVNIVNGLGFVLLVVLMLVVTAHDILKLL